MISSVVLSTQPSIVHKPLSCTKALLQVATIALSNAKHIFTSERLSKLSSSTEHLSDFDRKAIKITKSICLAMLVCKCIFSIKQGRGDQQDSESCSTSIDVAVSAHALGILTGIPSLYPLAIEYFCQEARQHYALNDYKLAAHAYAKASFYENKVLKTQNYRKKAIMCYKKASVALQAQGKLIEAAKALVKAAYYSPIGDKELLSQHALDLYNQIAQQYHQQRQFMQAAQLYHKAATSLLDMLFYKQLLITAAENYVKAQNSLEAAKLFIEIANLSQGEEKKLFLQKAAQNYYELAHECYTKSQFKEAALLLDKAGDIFTKIQAPLESMTCWMCYLGCLIEMFKPLDTLCQEQVAIIEGVMMQGIKCCKSMDLNKKLKKVLNLLTQYTHLFESSVALLKDKNQLSVEQEHIFSQELEYLGTAITQVNLAWEHWQLWRRLTFLGG